MEWTHSYCLACDKQVMTECAYCSEACRLADNEKSVTSSPCSSPGFTPTSYPWSTGSSSQFYLAPALDFTNSQRFPARQQPTRASYSMGSTTASTTTTSASTTRFLTPSSSHSSLCSMQSTSTNGDANQLSEKTRRELQAYAVSFEQVRMQRRRSY